MKELLKLFDNEPYLWNWLKTSSMSFLIITCQNLFMNIKLNPSGPGALSPLHSLNVYFISFMLKPTSSLSDASFFQFLKWLKSQILNQLSPLPLLNTYSDNIVQHVLSLAAAPLFIHHLHVIRP